MNFELLHNQWARIASEGMGYGLNGLPQEGAAALRQSIIIDGVPEREYYSGDKEEDFRQDIAAGSRVRLTPADARRFWGEYGSVARTTSLQTPPLPQPCLPRLLSLPSPDTTFPRFCA